EGKRLNCDSGLVVIEGNDRVELAPMTTQKDRVGRVRAGHIDLVLLCAFLDGGFDLGPLFGPKHAVLGGVRIEAGNSQLRFSSKKRFKLPACEIDQLDQRA